MQDFMNPTARQVLVVVVVDKADSTSQQGEAITCQRPSPPVYHVKDK